MNILNNIPPKTEKERLLDSFREWIAEQEKSHE